MEVPITGVVGVLGGSRAEVAIQVRRLGDPDNLRPDALEVRADLFEEPSEGLRMLDQLQGRFPVIFTVRLPGHGGHFHGEESVRAEVYREALRRGAALLDAEYDSGAARSLTEEGAPLIASFHDFRQGLESSGIERIEREMAALRPRALKIVPTAVRQADGLETLRWVARASRSGPGTLSAPARIAFAMGEAGIPSRVLSLAWGSAWTYGSLGEAVAPGQLTVRELKGLYRAGALGRSTRILGVVGRLQTRSVLAYLLNRAFGAHGIDAVSMPFQVERIEEIRPLAEALPIERFCVAPPFREDALRLADEVEPAVQACGRADALAVRAERRPAWLSAQRTESEEISTLAEALPDCGRNEFERAAAVARATIEFLQFTGQHADDSEFRRYLDSWADWHEAVQP